MAQTGGFELEIRAPINEWWQSIYDDVNVRYGCLLTCGR